MGSCGMNLLEEVQAREMMLDLVSMLAEKGHTREDLLKYINEDIVNEVFKIPNNHKKIQDIKHILEMYDENRDHYTEETLRDMIDRVAKVVWNVK